MGTRGLRAPTALAAIALALAACVAAPQGARAPADAGRRSATPRPAASRAASPAASAAASCAPHAGASPVGLRGAALRRPAGATVPLVGEVRMDASYMVAAGAGNIVAAGGGNIVAAGGLNLIGADGGSLIGADGGSLIGADGGSLIGADGGSLIGADGGSLIGADGGSLVSDDGSTLVAAGAGNMIAAAGGAMRAPVDEAGNLLPAGGGPAGYRLTQAPPAVGDQLPAAGMLVSVVRLSDHTYLPLGVDAAGKPVHAVYSNAKGGYEVWIPAAERGNVAIATGVPGRTDYRLNLNRVAEPAAGGQLAVDEVTALTARYLRLSITSRLAAAMQHPDLAIGLITYERAFSGAPEANGQAPVGSPFWRVVRCIEQVAAIARAEGLGEDTAEPAWREAAQRCVDASLGRVPLRELVTRVADLRYQEHVVEGRPVLEILGESTRVAHEGAARILRDRRDAFAQAFLAGTVNAPVEGIGELPPIGDWSGRIRKPGDVGEFLLVEYFSAARLGVVTPLRRLYTTFYEALPPDAAAGTAARRAEVLVANGRAACYTLLTTLARELQGPTVNADGTLAAPNAAFEAELRAICADVAARRQAP